MPSFLSIFSEKNFRRENKVNIEIQTQAPDAPLLAIFTAITEELTK